MTVQATTSALAPAAVATRVIAYIIDAIILGLSGIVILGLIINDVTIVGNITRAIIYAVLGFLYFGYTWTAWRASPGQRILGLMTVDATSGAALSWNQATMRWAFLFGPSVLNSLFPVGGGLGAIVGLVILVYYIYLLYTAATDARKQGFHDKQANSLVITKPAA
ncbi:MAG TPA: RDD family protein [Candidatus Limnocylindria bacterium]